MSQAMHREIERRVAAALAPEGPLEDSARCVLEALCATFGWSFGALWTVDRVAGALRCLASWHGAADGLERLAAARQGATLAPGVGLPGRAWSSRALHWLPNLLRDAAAEGDANPSRAEMQAGLACPLVSGGEVVGVLELAAERISEPDEALREALASVGAQVGTFLERRRGQVARELNAQDLADWFENVPHCMHWAAKDGTILRANQAELDLLGYPREEYVGRHVASFHVDSEAAEEILQRLARGETLKEHPARLRCRDGSVRHVRISSNVLWAQGEFVHTRCFTRDVTEAVRAEGALRESEERFRLMVDGVRDYAIHAISPDGRIASWNSGAARLHGYVAEEIVGADFSCLYLPADRASRLPERALREAGEKGESHSEGWRLRKDGSRFWADSVLTAHRDEHGNLRGFTRLARDDTDRKRAEATRRDSAEIAAENRRLVEAWRLQAEFLGTMSREMKTPLGAALAAAERLHDRSDGMLNAEQVAHVDDIRSGLRHVLRSFDAVFDVVRLESSRVRLRPQRVDVARLAQETRDVLRGQAAERHVQLELEAAPSLPQVEGDPALLKLVLHNLLWGAIRSAWAGGLVPLYLSAEGSDAVRIEVLDDGPDRSAVPGGPEGGPGEPGADEASGLAEMRTAVTRRIVEAHGGRVGVRELPAGGRMHFAVIPVLARVPAGGNDGGSEPEREGRPEERTVLVVEEDAAARAWLSWTLSNAGWSVYTAHGAEEALSLCRERPFHAVAVDLLLRRGLAADVVRRIRTEGMNRDVPVLLATMAGASEGVAGIRVDDVLSIPVRTDALFAALERARVPRGTGGSASVLVIESDPAGREGVLSSLRVLGYDAVGVAEGEAALRVAAGAPPAAVVLGIDPASGGMEFLRHFRRMPSGGAPVLVEVPVESDPVDRQRLHIEAQAHVLTCPGGPARILGELEPTGEARASTSSGS